MAGWLLSWLKGVFSGGLVIELAEGSVQWRTGLLS